MKTLSGTVIAFAAGISFAETLSGPVVVNTWFTDANAAAFELLSSGYAALDAVETGTTFCETAQCNGTVGWGNHPDTSGEVTLDAIAMDGFSMNSGAVGYLRNVRGAAAAARRVLHYSQSSLLVGDGATNFSIMSGLPAQTLESPASAADYAAWVAAGCQPNFYANWFNDTTACGPYTAIPTPSPTPLPAAVARDKPLYRRNAVYSAEGARAAAASHGIADARTGALAPKPPNPRVNRYNHDTIGMCALDVAGNLAAGASSNGADHKIAGRLGDVPVVGAAVYADTSAGCAAGTGDGDLTQRFLPAYQAVEFMRNGLSPQEACEGAVRRIMRIYNTSFQIGLVCMNPEGQIGAAAQGWTFTYAMASTATNNQSVAIQVAPLPPLAA